MRPSQVPSVPGDSADITPPSEGMPPQEPPAPPLADSRATPGHSELKRELQALVEYIETDLLPPALRRRVAGFPDEGLKHSLRDMLDWLSLRSILRGRGSDVSGRAHPLAGRVIARLPQLSKYVCAPDGRLEYRLEVPNQTRVFMEDLVKVAIWHRR